MMIYGGITLSQMGSHFLLQGHCSKQKCVTDFIRSKSCSKSTPGSSACTLPTVPKHTKALFKHYSANISFAMTYKRCSNHCGRAGEARKDCHSLHHQLQALTLKCDRVCIPPTELCIHLCTRAQLQSWKAFPGGYPVAATLSQPAAGFIYPSDRSFGDLQHQAWSPFETLYRWEYKKSTGARGYK